MHTQFQHKQKAWLVLAWFLLVILTRCLVMVSADEAAAGAEAATDGSVISIAKQLLTSSHKTSMSEISRNDGLEHIDVSIEVFLGGGIASDKWSKFLELELASTSQWIRALPEELYTALQELAPKFEFLKYNKFFKTHFTFADQAGTVHILHLLFERDKQGGYHYGRLFSSGTFLAAPNTAFVTTEDCNLLGCDTDVEIRYLPRSLTQEEAKSIMDFMVYTGAGLEQKLLGHPQTSGASSIMNNNIRQ